VYLAVLYFNNKTNAYLDEYVPGVRIYIYTAFLTVPVQHISYLPYSFIKKTTDSEPIKTLKQWRFFHTEIFVCVVYVTCTVNKAMNLLHIGYRLLAFSCISVVLHNARGLK